MANIAQVQMRVDAAADRLDSILNERARREREQQAREDAEAERAAAEKARWAAERKPEI